jgi:hypothetical protein
MAGKGSTYRPVNYSKFGPNYEHIFTPLEGKEALEKSLEDDQRMFQSDPPKSLHDKKLINIMVHGDDAQFQEALETLGLSKDDLLSPSDLDFLR